MRGLGVFVVGWLGLALAACGGGGGTAPPPSTPPLQFQAIAFARPGMVTRPLIDGTFTNVAAGGAGTGAISYESSNTAVATVNARGVVTLLAAGDAVITANKASDTAYRAATANYNLNVTANPGAPALGAITLNPDDPFPGGTVGISASASDPQESALDFAWDFGDGSTGLGAGGNHAFTAEGEYPVRVTVTNAYGLSATAMRTVSVAWRPLQSLALVIPNPRHLEGDVLFGDLDFQEPNGLDFDVSWDLGDGTASTDTTVRHQYASTGNYVVRVTVTNARGSSASAQQEVTVSPRVGQPTPVDNTFQVYCAGPYCGAQDATTYRGSGVGIWRYHNATDTPATIDVAIDGLRQGQVGSLVFSNGSSLSVPTQPAFGRIVAGKADVRGPTETDPHLAMLERNRQVFARHAGLSVPVRKGPLQDIPRSASSAARAATVIGDTRSWRDAFDRAARHQIKAAATCVFSTGRRGVVWTDDDPSHVFDAAQVQLVADYLCGPQGVYERMVALHGDVYGPAASDARYIQDTPGLQELNIVIIEPGKNAGWGGYFSAEDLLVASESPDSNEAVAVVLSGGLLDGGFTARQALVHELKHLVNGYRRGIARGVSHASWLEESSATLAADLINSELSPGNPMEERMGQVLPYGGLVSLLDWGSGIASNAKYAFGGSFGSFLQRRYGNAYDAYLLDTCEDHGQAFQSYRCVDDFIKTQGGAGFADEFARLGVSLYAFVGGPSPRGFGFRGALVGPAHLRPVATPPVAPFVPPAAFSAGEWFKATSHTYSFTFMSAGQTRFVREDVVVPQGTTLMVVVNEAPP